MSDPPRLLDVTRLLSRAGRGPFTGIDRVELAYLDALLARPEPVFALARSAPGHALLDRDGMASLRARIVGDLPWGPADLISRMHLRQSPLRRQAMSDLRRLAVGWTLTRGLPRLLKRNLPPNPVYLNTGHSNLAPDVMAALQRLRGARIGVLIHDTIPLDYPEFTRAGVSESFERRLRLVGQGADLAIYNSLATRLAAERHFAAWGRVPEGLVAHLGVIRPRPDPAALEPVWPAQLDRHRPYFVVLGTIEPRKNHAFLLDIWDGFARDLPDHEIPALCIAGARGWRNEAVFHRLDTGVSMRRHVFELSGLNDGAAAALLDGARALLFPSHAEGFGLPALEAASLGVPVVCNDLPVFREVAGKHAVFATVADRNLWEQKILALAHKDAADAWGTPLELPTWDAHFSRVLSGACWGLA